MHVCCLVSVMSNYPFEFLVFHVKSYFVIGELVLLQRKERIKEKAKTIILCIQNTSEKIRTGLFYGNTNVAFGWLQCYFIWIICYSSPGNRMDKTGDMVNKECCGKKCRLLCLYEFHYARLCFVTIIGRSSHTNL